MATTKKNEGTPTTPQAPAGSQPAAPVVSAPTPDTTAQADPEMATAKLPETTVRIFLAKVKEEWRFDILQSAGRIFPKGAETPVRADDPAFDELRSNPYLEITEE